MALTDVPIARLDGTPATLGEITGGRPALVVNVASKCGLTPQYSALEALQEQYADRGFTVVGVPCNQFGGQEPGTAEEISEFCSATYGVTFPMTEKVEVNGEHRHPLYDELVATPYRAGIDLAGTDLAGTTGDIAWNFEKFLLDRTGAVVARFAPGVVPDDPRVTDAVESVLP
jgi:glutathione peroxidase